MKFAQLEKKGGKLQKKQGRVRIGGRNLQAGSGEGVRFDMLAEVGSEVMSAEVSGLTFPLTLHFFLHF